MGDFLIKMPILSDNYITMIIGMKNKFISICVMENKKPGIKPGKK
jgi:hypothetical protein